MQSVPVGHRVAVKTNKIFNNNCYMTNIISNCDSIIKHNYIIIFICVHNLVLGHSRMIVIDILFVV